MDKLGGKMENGMKDNSKEWPIFTEKHWYVAALSLVIVGVVLASFAVAWVFSGDGLAETKARLDLLTPPVTIYLAIVTFCTVAWRGMVTSRQADQQQRQNDAKDEENLAKLLVDGTKLVSDDDAKSAQVHAGIAALHVVSSAPLDRFAVHAMDILILVIEKTYKAKNQAFVFNAAKDALHAAALQARSSTRGLVVSSDKVEDIVWPAINGAAHVRYIGGNFSTQEYSKILDKSRVSFSGVYFEECHISAEAAYFKGCEFSACTFDRLTRGMCLRASMNSCDFSGTFIDIKSVMPDGRRQSLQKIKDGNCFYVIGKPPTGLAEDELVEFFNAVEPVLA